MQLDPELYMFFTVSPHKKSQGSSLGRIYAKGKNEVMKSKDMTYVYMN
jgi:hypothetical protein